MAKQDDAILGTILAIMATASIAFLFLSTKDGIEKTERAECLKWKEEALTLQGYYLEQWQKDQCDARGITIETTIQLTN